MSDSTYATPQWSTKGSGTHVPALAGLVHRRAAATADAHVLGAPCRPWSGSLVSEIPALFGNGRPAMLATGAPRLKEPST